jgi:hypothetical protein
MAVYIFEQVDIIGPGRGKLIELFRSGWARNAEVRYGVRLRGLWATVGSSAAWPEACWMWEMDDWEHFARAQAAQYPLEDKDPYGTELWRQALAWRSGGVSSLLVPAACTPTGAELAASGNSGQVYLVERLRARPGGLDAYHAALVSEYLATAATRGQRLVGAYADALRPNCGLNLWCFESWEHLRDAIATEATDAGARAWRRRGRELLEDSRGFLLAPPPQGLLRT